MTADGESNNARSVSLPLELLDQVAVYLDPKDVANVRLACIQLCQIFTPYLVNHLTLKLSGGVTLTGQLLYPFIPTPDIFVKFIKSLDIELNYYHFTVAMQSARETLVSAYGTEVARLVSLRSVKITTRSVNFSSDDDSIYWLGDMEARLLDAIADPTRLRNLETDSLPFLRKSPTSWTKFTHLKTFTLMKIIPIPVGYPSINEQINAFLACVPTITTLSLEAPFQSSTILVHDIFPSPSIHPHLSLQSLSFDGNFAWSRTAIPPLTGLSGSCFSNLRQLVLKTSHEDMDTDWDHFWDFLRHANTQLRVILLGPSVTPSFLEYLASLRGLQTLALLLRPLNPISFDIAERLITQVLPLHASSLQKLFVPLLCIGIHPDLALEGFSFISTWPAPSHFLHLKYLCASSQRGLTFSLETCQSLLEWLEQFPSLEHCLIMFQSYWDVNPVLDTPDFRETGNKLIGLTGRPREWTLMYDPNVSVETRTWRANEVEDGRWDFIEIPQGYKLTWIEEMS